MSTVSNGRRRAFRSRHRTPMGEGGKLAIIFVSLALILFVLAVMLGNYLRSLAEEIIDETTDTAADTQIIPSFAKAPEKMIGRGIVFGVDYSYADITDAMTETFTDDVASEESTAQKDQGLNYDAVSVMLRCRSADGGMLLAYNSEVSLQYSLDDCGETSLEDGFSLIRRNWGNDVRICAVFEVDYTKAPANTSGIVRAYEMALLFELIEEGVDEILLIGFSDNIDEGIEFIADIYTEKGRATELGLSLEFDFVNADDADMRISEIAKKCGFLALDLYSLEIPGMQSAESLICDRVSRTKNICREYSIRVMLGCGIDPDCELQTAAAMSVGADNVMTVLGLPERTQNGSSDTPETK